MSKEMREQMDKMKNLLKEDNNIGNNIPTAEEILDKNAMSVYEDVTGKYILNAMIEFAKLHVEAALKAASETEVLYLRNGNAYTDEKAIINSYPIDNIK